MTVPTIAQTGKVVPTRTCRHGRLIDDVLTKSGKRTGQVRCLECGAVFDDPYQGKLKPAT